MMTLLSGGTCSSRRSSSCSSLWRRVKAMRCTLSSSSSSSTTTTTTINNNNNPLPISPSLLDKPVYDLVRNEIRQSIVKAFGETLCGTIDPLVFPAKAAHGDYQCNVAMSLSKQVKLPPQEVAKRIMDQLSCGSNAGGGGGGVIGAADISGPGFINLHLAKSFLAQKVLFKLQDPSQRLGIPWNPVKEKVIVDFSSPNIAKEMHV
eukprot:scaffold14435_cov266-Ochromonas_danica.AAC.3